MVVPERTADEGGAKGSRTDETDFEILIVEDDPAIAESLADGLGHEGYRVHWESTGRGGVSYARQHNPRLVILDVRLPDGSGFDFCREMRQSGLRQPILMLTVQTDEMDKVLGLEMGADDYLTKPYRLRELLARYEPCPDGHTANSRVWRPTCSTWAILCSTEGGRA